MPNAFPRRQQENASATTGSGGSRDGYETTGNEQQKGNASDTSEGVDTVLNISLFILGTFPTFTCTVSQAVGGTSLRNY